MSGPCVAAFASLANQHAGAVADLGLRTRLTGAHGHGHMASIV